MTATNSTFEGSNQLIRAKKSTFYTENINQIARKLRPPAKNVKVIT